MKNNSIKAVLFILGIFISVMQVSHAGLLDRKGAGDDSRERMRQNIAARESYQRQTVDRANALNNDREQIAAFTTSVIRMSAEAGEMQTQCGTVHSIQESDKCLEMLKGVMQECLNLEIKLAGLAESKDREIAEQARQPLENIRMFRESLYRTLRVWTGNRAKLASASRDQSAAEAARRGRRRAQCEAGPLGLRAQISEIESKTAEGEAQRDPYMIFKASHLHNTVFSFLSELKENCGINLESEARQLARLNLRINQTLKSPKYLVWFQDRCQAVQKTIQEELHCEGGPTPALLFSIHGIEQERARKK